MLRKMKHMPKEKNKSLKIILVGINHGTKSTTKEISQHEQYKTAIAAKHH